VTQGLAFVFVCCFFSQKKIKKVSMSAFADDYIVIHCNDFDQAFSDVHKTGFFLFLRRKITSFVFLNCFPPKKIQKLRQRF
jgi:hypothetical protein